MNSLLKRQLRKTLGDPDSIPQELIPLLDLISDAYDSYETDRKLIERSLDISSKELREANKTLEDALTKLNNSNEQLSQFVYIASHDLREPLRKISSFGLLLCDSLSGRIDEDDQENLNFMIDGANRMQQMIEALLIYSRITTKGVDFVSVDVNNAIEDLISFELSIKIEESKAKINIEKPLLAVNADPAQLRQLLQNFIANSLKYQDEGIIPEVTIRSKECDNNMVRIEVQDNGIGINENQLKNVFVMFHRLHSRQEYEGTGIGLAVCKRIVERHGGDIGVNSSVGEGSTFWFTLPAASVVAREPQEQVKT